MSTVSIPTTTRPLIWRFAWKEYRMLRGFWLACAIIAVLLQSLPTLTYSAYRNLGTPIEHFAIAWGAVALYLAGAAVILFCAETEERTRDYLRLLPGDWKSIFGTKVAMALSSAVFLACVLSTTAWWFAGYRWPSPQDATRVFGTAGVAALEFLAWGLLFSLWWKHPLLAAGAAIAAASFGAQWAIFATTSANNSWTAEAYVEAVPGRLTICLIVFAVDVWLGRRWLYPVPTQGRAVSAKPASGLLTASKKAERPRLKMFSRLLWQTWRESWKAILVAVPLSIALVAVSLIPAYVSNVHDFLRALPFVSLIPPALLGALAFRADQQRDHRLFLATHAVWPRYMWLARNAVWLGVMVLLATVLHLTSSWIMRGLFQGELQRYLDGHWSYYSDWLGREFSTDDPRWAQAYRFEYMQSTYARGVLTTWLAFLAAYGIGQLCSMALKQTLLSGFLAILLAIVIGAWSVLMYLWEMNPLWFVLPIGVGALLATWLRVPSWILEQNRFKHWLGPAGAVALPLVVMVGYVPLARMAQIDAVTPALAMYDEPFSELDAQHERTKTAASQTALEYERLGAEIDEDDERILKYFGLDLPQVAELQELAERVTELTKQPYCRFPTSRVVPGTAGGRYLLKLQLLLLQDASRLRRQGQFDLALERLVAAVNLLGDMSEHRQSWEYAEILSREGACSFEEAFTAILDWAQAEGQTSERLKEANDTLNRIFTALPRPSDAMYADRERVRRIILEEEPPGNNRNDLALFLNRLPGEQKRALRSLDILAAQSQQFARAIEGLIGETSLQEPYGANRAEQLRNDLRITPWSSMYAIHPRIFDGDRYMFRTASQLADACATSFLVAEEFENSGNLRQLLIEWTDFVTRARALSLQLALTAYTIDHGDYPETLDALVPDYLAGMIHDPYSGKPFEYRHEGLNLPLKPRNENQPEFEPVPSGTPLFWSVGVGNCKLNEYTEGHIGGFGYGGGMMGGEMGGRLWNGPIEEPDAVSFHPTEVDGHWQPNGLVFPLPEIEPVEADNDEAGT